MQFGFCGINYKKSSLEIRDYVSFSDSKKITFYEKLNQIGVNQSMILSTCNRSEIYYVCEREALHEQVRQIFLETFSDKNVIDVLEYGEGKEAVIYLFRVAAGLESQILGEDQILGQVVEAADFSRTMGQSRKELNYITREAIACAKAIKTKFKISEIPLSIGYVGVKKIDELFGLNEKNVLIIGSGQTAKLALQYVLDYDVKSITVCNRTRSHANRLQKEFTNVDVIPFEQRYDKMKDCDVIISATASPHKVVMCEEVPQTGDKMFLDLASPRDIDEALRECEAFSLVNIDDLQDVVEKNKEARKTLSEEGYHYILEWVEDVERWLFSSRMDDTIESIQVRCDNIVEDSCRFLQRKLDMSEREKKIVKKTLQAGFKRLLREPVLELKNLETPEEQEKYKKTIEKLFGL
ncbi:MAG: glutamyl-tRNA reductase [Eubacterium sp.]|nr:glutamyl-tRNA reductase [Eubacterium sp.]